MHEIGQAREVELIVDEESVTDVESFTVENNVDEVRGVGHGIVNQEYSGSFTIDVEEQDAETAFFLGQLFGGNENAEGQCREDDTTEVDDLDETDSTTVDSHTGVNFTLGMFMGFMLGQLREAEKID